MKTIMNTVNYFALLLPIATVCERERNKEKLKMSGLEGFEAS